MFVFLLLLAGLLAGVVQVEDDTEFDCALLSADELALTPALLSAVQLACVNDPTCSVLFAQEELDDQSTFAHILQVVEPHGAPLTWQSPLREVLCGESVDSALAKMWVRSLVVAARRLQICAPDEQLELTDGGAAAECKTMLHSTYNSPGNYYGFIIAALVGVIVLLAGLLGTKVYHIIKQ